MIKMIVTDLDGTLLRDDKTISERTIRALTGCRKKGIKVAYATVRGYADRLAPDELFDGRVLKSGAVAYIDNKRVYYKTMSINDARPFLLSAHEANLKTAAQNDDGVHYSNFHVSEIWPFLTNYKIVDFATIDFDIAKIYVVTDTPESMEFVKNHAPAGFHLFVSRDDLSFLFHSDATKSKAVAALAQHWGINRSEIAAFGDDLVDAELLEYCGVGIAVDNAIGEVKQRADFICDSNENDGVAKWLEGNVL